jgi:hypothetical protein
MSANRPVVTNRFLCKAVQQIHLFTQPKTAQSSTFFSPNPRRFLLAERLFKHRVARQIAMRQLWPRHGVDD